MIKTAAPFNCAVVRLIELYLYPLKKTVVAYATTKKVNEQDMETFPKCCVGRNGKRNQ